MQNDAYLQGMKMLSKKKADTHRLNKGSMLALGEKRGRKTLGARHYFMALLL